MPIQLSPRVVAELNVNLVALFDLGANEASGDMSAVMETCYVATSDTAQGVYTLTNTDYALYDRGASAEMIIDGVKLYETRLKDGKKYKIIQVDLDAFEDDKVGQYSSVFYRLGKALALGPTRLMEDTIIASETAAPLGNYDGVPLISTSHPVRPFEPGSPVWSNKLVRPNGLGFPSFSDAYTAFSLFPGEDGRPLGHKPRILMVAPAYRQIGWDICYSDRPLNQSGGGNSWKGEVNLMVVPQLSAAAVDAWYLVDNSSSLERPWIYQERRALRMIPLFSSHEDPHVVKSRKLEWMIDGRIGGGWGHANRILKVTKS